jgi:DNA-binding CsgD family transcriptional regulator
VTGLSRPGALVAVDLADGVIALLSGEMSTAWQRLHAAARTLDEVGAREPSVPGVLPLAIEAGAALGELTDAQALCTRLDEQTRAVGSRWGAAALLASQAHIAAARGDTAQGVELFDDAAAAFAGIDLPLPQGRALLAAGSALRRTGHRSEARQRLLAARTLFERTGAISLVADADAELARLGGPGDGSTLTMSERQVAQLAAGGMRNTEIAVKLQISPKTVEHHLGRVYRKLGVRGRADLAGVLDRRDPIATH